MTCQPMGIPRQGPPGRIFQTEDDITLLYGRGGDGGGGYSDFRVIATDGREVSEREVIQTKYTGHSVGHWEGDTLVIVSVGMKVTERFTRQGDQMLYESTVEDPQVLLQPWELDPMLMTLVGDNDTGGFGGGRLIGSERGSCQDIELDDISWQIHH